MFQGHLKKEVYFCCFWVEVFIRFLLCSSMVLFICFISFLLFCLVILSKLLRAECWSFLLKLWICQMLLSILSVFASHKCQSTPVSLPGGPDGQRSLAGYSSWVLKSQTELSDLVSVLISSFIVCCILRLDYPPYCYIMSCPITNFFSFCFGFRVLFFQPLKITLLILPGLLSFQWEIYCQSDYFSS